MLVAFALNGCVPAVGTPTPAAPTPALLASDRPSVGGVRIARLPERADTRLAGVVESIAAGHQGTLGVVVKHLRSGATATLNAERHFRAASLYKLFVLYVAFAQMGVGALATDEILTLSKEAFDAEPYAEWAPGTRTTVACALQAMVTISSNAATAMLVERLGGEERITAEIRALGLEQSELTRDYAGTSPADIALLLEYIVTKQAVSATASENMLALLGDQRRNDRLPLPLPLGVKVAHKTGELPKLRNDAGIVYAPSGPYLFVALASGAPSDAGARAAILDLSRAVYAHFEPGGLQDFLGLPPRLAAEVFRLPDAQGRLAPLDDQWAETVPISATGVILSEGIKDVNLREMVVPDLLALQRAAAAAGADFWVSAGFRSPSGGDAPLALADATAPPCPVELPPQQTPTGQPPQTPTPSKPGPLPYASQHWLGTLVAVADAPSGKPTAPDYASSAAGRWLIAHAWEYGFVAAPAESPAGNDLDFEPWKLRWVGRQMAARLHDLGYERNPTAIVTAELRRAQHDLAGPPPSPEVTSSP